MSSIAPVTERLVSADSHVHFTDDWVKARLPNRLHSVTGAMLDMTEPPVGGAGDRLRLRALRVIVLDPAGGVN